LADSTFGLGAVLCLVAVLLFAWATRATTRNFPSLTAIGQTTITLIGGLVFMQLVYVIFLLTDLPGAQTGATDTRHVLLMLIFALVSLAVPQLLWIRGAGSTTTRGAL